MFLCDHYVADAAGKQSFIGVFQAITLRVIPSGLARFFFITSVWNASGTRIEIVLTRPDGTSTALISHELPVAQEEPGQYNIAIEFANLAFTQIGSHKMSLKFDDRVLGSVDFTVAQGGPPDATKQSA